MTIGAETRSRRKEWGQDSSDGDGREEEKTWGGSGEGGAVSRKEGNYRSNKEQPDWSRARTKDLRTNCQDTIVLNEFIEIVGSFKRGHPIQFSFTAKQRRKD
ncbi:unnamed protein product [Nezara viridula]|uniref:Uncharacterized protein n=1 Tax=Nezara viridula TaxID=85310 RepID=A0A9P0HFM8_NEZVI|nr:unnamed protein product [Nezara viridula]